MPEVHNPNLQSQGSGGGGGGGGDMRSTMALMLIVLAAFFGYQYFFMKPKPEPPAPAQTQSQTQAAAPAAQAPQAQSSPVAASGHAPGASAQVAAALETNLTVENEFYRIVFTNRGAQVKHWFLKRYFDSKGKPLDMVQQDAAAKFGLPLSLFTYDTSLTNQLNQALYQSTVAGLQPSATGLVLSPNSITYHYAANGLDVVKTFRFDTSYVVAAEAQVKQNGAPVRALVEWPAGLGDMEEFQQSGMLRTHAGPTPSYFAWALNGKEESLAISKGQRKQYAESALPVRSRHGSLLCFGIPAGYSR